MSLFQSSKWSLIPGGGGITAPSGYKAAGIKAGLKSSEKLDLALILAPPDALCAGAFTKSLVRAKCIDVCIERLSQENGKVRAILINSGQANACTGSRGLEDSLIATKGVADRLGVSVNEVLICSTGVIGQPIPINNLLNGLDPLVNALNKTGGADAAKAILTTDLSTKEIAIEAFLGGKCVRIGGMAKGSGMIHPDMATMLGFLTCDIAIPKVDWDSMIKRVVDDSFNLITVDGDTSTNDSVLAFSGGAPLDKQYFEEIEIGLKLVSTYLAKSIVRDGEGANCVIEVKVEGAKNKFDAGLIARTICSSSLVKTAVHGCDPNWGRIIAAAGRSGVPFQLDNTSLWIGPFQLMGMGLPLEFNSVLIRNYMRTKIKGKNVKLEDKTVPIKLVIGEGSQQAIAWGCDLSDEYIRINADYTT
ncbi:bifunctional glutamate N-acetyltransferase/amino-acid acetyltransferase ArgJ [Prochlorococcus marinus]|uniref:bifunctional glutamate N-acetyltransferase/amino-acid acetyltransferase ArgJ n=1 Tax=Prochlorococcus marinus TaxID=1219 RepID=UPI0022B434EC|nr:bifunctional glutamate N-acetyltransferase/amino-acid acetyltransferase ArgJ [Prochlorococcus marinus]